MSRNILIRFGMAIRKIRCEQHLSQEELAERCGLHRTYISDVELGKRNVSLENIERLGSSLNKGLVELFDEVNQV